MALTLYEGTVSVAWCVMGVCVSTDAQVLLAKACLGVFFGLLMGVVYSGGGGGQRAVYDELSLLFFAAFSQVSSKQGACYH